MTLLLFRIIRHKQQSNNETTQADYMNIPVPVFQILPILNCPVHVQDYAELVELAGGEEAHISISDGSVLALKLYSILPGSKNRKRNNNILY